MRYSLRDIAGLLRTPVGRARLRMAAYFKAWPLMSMAAAVHRRTLSRHVRIVTVVGSFGKTTTARAVAAALGAEDRLLIEFNWWSYLAGGVLRLRPRDRWAVMEVAIGDTGQMAQYAWMLRPDVAVVTSIGTEHRRSLPTLEITRQEKSEIVAALPPSGLAVLNGDDPHVLWMARRSRAPVVTFGFGEANEVRATDVQVDGAHGTRFTLHVAGRRAEMTTRLVGHHSVRAILAAVAAAHSQGLELGRALPALETLPASPGRMQIAALPGGVSVLLDDYKSQRETIESALDALASETARRRIAVLGEVEEPGRPQGADYRRIGARLPKVTDAAVFVGRQGPLYAKSAARAGMAKSAMHCVGPNVARAAEALRDLVRPGDVVLIKGRSTQKMQRIHLALAGRRVRCDIELCRAPNRCADCAMLERGWHGLRVVT